MKTAAIIPARMASTRFPGKPLADLFGKPIIQWVYERASRARSVGRVVVATCDQEIAAAVGRFGGEFAMTSPHHRSGTDRVAEVAAHTDVDVVVNVQGDEPLIDPGAIDRALEPFQVDPCVLMTSLMVAIDRSEAMNPNVVKVVVDLKGDALYFSRNPVPYERNVLADRRFWGHVGLYAYRRDFLLTLASLEPTPLEEAESLEQLRVLEHGFRIRMVEVDTRPLGVDTPEDLERARLTVLGQGG